ncbi:MAG: hypothetical protein NVSMB25_22290 [Thermoleophilaceae bacterium]
MRRWAELGAVRIGAVTAVATLTLAGGASAQARPRLSAAGCTPQCTPGAPLSLRGSGFGRGTTVVFTIQSSLRRGHSAGRARVITSRRLGAQIPAAAVTGSIYVRRGHARSNSLLLRVAPLRNPAPPASAASGTAFDRNGMWIWYVNRSSGGQIPTIIAQAHEHNVGTLFIKSSDGSDPWPQFSPALVSQLKAGGLNVCAWQYVYGTHPTVEARLGAAAVQSGADCLVIDAEMEYEGRYAQAQTYISALRAAIGPAFPVGLSSFPYVDYHESLPFSVFLAPGAAQFNLPQIYWKAIGVSVAAAVNHTYSVNTPYGRPIDPLGQAYDHTSPADILRFRSLVQAAGSSGISWWDWQEATSSEFTAIGQPLTAPAARRSAAPATLSSGARGDLVVWAQEHLRGAGRAVKIDGRFGAPTKRAVTAFQSAAGLPATGAIDSATWTALLRYRPTSWRAGGASAASTAGGRTGPPSAFLPAKRYEIPKHRG